jgi:hypothetical protein
MVFNTEYLVWAKKAYPELAKIPNLIPNDVDEYRRKLGYKERPERFRPTNIHPDYKMMYLSQLEQERDYAAKRCWTGEVAKIDVELEKRKKDREAHKPHFLKGEHVYADLGYRTDQKRRPVYIIDTVYIIDIKGGTAHISWSTGTQVVDGHIDLKYLSRIPSVKEPWRNPDTFAAEYEREAARGADR